MIINHKVDVFYNILVPMKWKIFAAYLKGFSKYRRMAFFFLGISFFFVLILILYYAN